MRAEIEEIETNSKIKNIRDWYRGISDFKKGYQSRTNIVKDEKGDLVVDSRSISVSWRIYFSQLLNVHGVNDFRQREIHTEKPLVPEPSACEVALAVEKLRSHKSPGVDQIPAESIRYGVEQFAVSFTSFLFLFGIRRNCLRSGRIRSLYLSIRRAINEFVVIIGTYHFSNYVQNFVQHPAVKINSMCRGNYWGSSMWISTLQVNY